jgi:hypothetical protein
MGKMRDVRRAMMLAAGAAGVILSATACATPPGASGRPAPSAPATGTSTEPAATTGSGEGSGGGSENKAGNDKAGDDKASGDKASGDKASGGETDRCHPGDLKIYTEAMPGGGAAGKQGKYVVFENVTAAACSLRGYPGVSFVAGDDGHQVGSAFKRVKAETPLIMLTPGDRVQSTVVLANAGNFDAASCKPVDVRGFRIYPPGETGAVFVEDAQQACSATGQGVGEVMPMAPMQK